MIVAVVAVRMMQVAVVQVIDMSPVLGTRMTTVLTVNMLMSVVYFVFH